MIAGWHRLFGTFTGVALLTIAALPVAVAVTWRARAVADRPRLPSRWRGARR